MSSPIRRLLPVLLLALLVSQAGAQTFEASYSALAAANPKGGAFTIRLTAGPVFREGELMPFEFTFRPGAGQRFSFAGALIDPGPGCGDLSHPCQVVDMRTWSKHDPMYSLDLPRDAAPRRSDLNIHIPRLKPGRYRVALLARLMVQQGQQGSWRYAEPPRYLVSSRIEFEVVPATLEWIRQTISQANAVLESTPTDRPHGYEEIQSAARRLRFLQHPLAWEASLAHFGDGAGGNDLLFGMWEAERPAEVCALMQARIANPAQYVTFSYLTYLADICRRARPDYDARKWNAEVAAQRAGLLSDAAAVLAANLAPRSGATKGAAIYSLLEYLESARDQALPAWVTQLRQEAAASYFDLPPYMQGGLISGGYWSLLRGPEMVALLKRVLAARITDYNVEQNWNGALRRLHEVAPAEARSRMLAEFRNPDTRIDESTLALLDPASVPDVDDALIETLDGAQRHPAGNARMATWMIARYASSHALKRIKAIFESQQNPCQPALIAYFLRTDPAYADAVFHRHPWNMLGEAPCALEYFTVTPKIRMHPVLEKYMVAYLMHADVRLKLAAAEALGRYGSPAARQPLWEAYRYFHNFWKDRRQEMGATQANEMLEAGLRSAIARARNWLANEPELHQLESLCLNQRCLWETRMDLEAWRTPLRLEVWSTDPSGFRATVAQYGDLTSLEQLQGKLKQFPKGTAFRLQVTPNNDGLIAELRRHAVAAGMALAQ